MQTLSRPSAAESSVRNFGAGASYLKPPEAADGGIFLSSKKNQRNTRMDASDTKELRGDAPAELVQALDAFAQADGMSRNALVVQVLMAYAKDRAHKVTLVSRMLRGNPLLGEPSRIHE